VRIVVVGVLVTLGCSSGDHAQSSRALCEGGPCASREAGVVRTDGGSTADARAVEHMDARAVEHMDARAVEHMDGAASSRDAGYVTGVDAAPPARDAAPADATPRGQLCDAGTTVCGAVCTDLDTDSANCGRCGNSCGGTCTDGRCVQTIATVEGGAFGMTLDADNVYFIAYAETGGSPGHGGVDKVAKTGGAVTPLVSILGLPTGIAVRGTDVYYGAGKSLMKVPIAGGAPKIVTTSGGFIQWVAANTADVVYVADSGANSQSGTVEKASPTVTDPVILAKELAPPFAVALDDTSAYWTTNESVNFPQTSSTVMKIGLNGGTPVPLASAQVSSLAIAADQTTVYWVSNEGVFAVPSAGGQVRTIATQSSVNYLAIDATSVYWLAGSLQGASVMKAPKQGGDAVPIATLSASRSGNGIAVDGASVYVEQNGTVLKITPK
jgi:hypothetical protein